MTQAGTGKTLTSLRLTEEWLDNEGKRGGGILFLAPSIALVGQSMRSWANQSKKPMVCAVVCSDKKASSMEEDVWESSLSDLPYPATTDAKVLFEQMKHVNDEDSLVVIFSTYQSIQVVSDAQKMGLPEFDIVFCDEAHRTTGAIGKTEEKSEYVKVHDNDVIAAKKRLYMTATPRIYGDRIKKMAKADSYVISSMDDEMIFGPELYHLSFGRAVDEKLLTDYKVIALTMPENVVSLEVFRKAYPEGFTNRLMKDGGPEINKEDIFYYIYGILHSPEYRKRFESNLKKELPRIPLSKNFRAFSKSGRALADLHIHYEDVEMYPLEAVGDETNPGHVQKMKWERKRIRKP